MQHRKLTAALVAAALTVSACGDDSGGSDGNSDGEEGATGPGCGPSAPGDLTEGAQVFEFGDEEPAYLLALPDDYDGETTRPLILNFHGLESDKESHEADTSLAEAGTARGYVVVTPDSVSGGQDGAGAGAQELEWSMGEGGDGADFGVMNALIDELGESLCIDDSRIYVAGHSVGSVFAGTFACREPYHVAATAMVGGFMPPTCEPANTPPVLAIHGTDDPVFSYEGGTGSVPLPPLPGVLEVLGYYAQHLGCEEPDGPDEGKAPAPGVERRSLRDCAQGSGAVLYTVEGGGAEWPGGQADSGDFSATEAILDFFDEQEQ